MIVDNIIAQRNKLLGEVEFTILCDNLSFHRDVAMAKKFLDNKIYLVFLPPGTSHFTQPLDSTAFAVFKMTLAKKARELADALWRSGGAMKLAELLSAATCLAAHISFSKEHVMDSFARTFIFPFDGDAIVERARINAGVPEPKKNGKEASLVAVASQAMANIVAKQRKLRAEVEEATQRVSASVTYSAMYDAHSLIIYEQKRRQEADEKEAALQEERKNKELKRQERERQRDEAAAASQAKREERLAKKRAREEDMERRTCRADDCSRKWTDLRCRDWLYCEYCDNYSLCPEHWSSVLQDAGQALMRRHEAKCDNRPAKRARRK